MAMEWLKLTSTTKAKKSSGQKRSVTYKVLAPAGHCGTEYTGRPKLIDPEAFLDNAISEYGKKIVSQVFFKQFVVQAQNPPRRLMEQGVTDHLILSEMENWKLMQRVRQDAKAIEQIITDRWMAEFDAAETMEEKMAVLERIRARQSQISYTEIESENGDENGDEDEYEDDEELISFVTDSNGSVGEPVDSSEEPVDSSEEPADSSEVEQSADTKDDTPRNASGRFQRRPR